MLTRAAPLSVLGTGSDAMFDGFIAEGMPAGVSATEDLLGVDLEVPSDPDASIPISPTGDLRVLGGRPNLDAALRRRVSTSPGTLLHRPEYGAGMPDFLEQPHSPALRQQLASQIRRNVLREPRIANVRVSVGVAVPDRPIVTLDVTYPGQASASSITV